MTNKIYLIDLNGNHKITVENDACVGREQLQNCEDKRISRKHAIFTIEGEKITITATHTNPLFYRTKSDISLKSLLKNAVVELEESDEIGFLPDKFWFRISSIKPENIESNQIDDQDTEEIVLAEPEIQEPALPTIRVKNTFEINQLSSTSDVAGSSTIRVMNASDINLLSSMSDVTSSNTIRIKNPFEINQLSSTSNVAGSSTDSQKSKRPSWMLDQNYDVGSSSAKKQKPNISVEMEDEDESTISVRDIPDDEPTNLNESVASPPVIESNNEVPGNDLLPTTANEADEDVDKKEIIKVAEMPSSSDTPEGNNGASAISPTTVADENLDKKEDILKIAVTPACSDIPDGSDDASTSSSTAINASATNALATNAPATNAPATNAPTSSATTTGAPTTNSPQVSTVTVTKAVKVAPADSSSIRDSCNFGIKCYRRNPAHLSEFAHPGDSDYKRPDFPPAPPSAPDCQYGNACYRRNPTHFQIFKHPPSTNAKRNRRKLRKKIVDSGDSQLSTSAIILTKRERKKRLLNLDYDLSDDDDESDPFDDTDDDEEFVPSDDETDDD